MFQVHHCLNKDLGQIAPASRARVKDIPKLRMHIPSPFLSSLFIDYSRIYTNIQSAVVRINLKGGQDNFGLY